MVKAVETARKAAKKAIESTYEGVCTVIERRDVRNETTKITHKTEVTVIENQPCKLSFLDLQYKCNTKEKIMIHFNQLVV